MSKLRTAFYLAAEFETGLIPLERVAEKYLGMTPVVAAKKARSHQLPFPVFRAGGQKSGWIVQVDDLAAYLDACRTEQAKAWKDMNDAA